MNAAISGNIGIRVHAAVGLADRAPRLCAFGIIKTARTVNSCCTALRYTSLLGVVGVAAFILFDAPLLFDNWRDWRRSKKKRGDKR